MAKRQPVKSTAIRKVNETASSHERANSEKQRPDSAPEELSTPTDGAMSQTDAAVNSIRSRIIDLTIQPGSRIDERLLLNDFMLGRTPAREAINRLVAEGFVNIVPNRGGTFVRKLDFEEIGQILIAHQLAENILGQLMRFEPGLAEDLTRIQNQYAEQVHQRAFLNITALNEQFHMRMNRAVGNSFFYEFAQSTHRHVRRLLVHLYKLEADATPREQNKHFEKNLREHQQIIDVIREENRTALVELLPSHAKATQDRFVQILMSREAPKFRLKLGQLPAASGVQ
jgi:DNA-binding GntR family transcriptional regulator